MVSAANDERENGFVDAFMNLFLYAPIGFALDAREVVPKLANRGREQVGLLKVAAQFALMKGRADADRIMQRQKPATAPAGPAAKRPPAGEAETRPRAASSVSAVNDLAIPRFDTLSASQILPRLASLSAAELAAVERYERANRKRRTILARIDQLRAANRPSPRAKP